MHQRLHAIPQPLPAAYCNKSVFLSGRDLKAAGGGHDAVVQLLLHAKMSVNGGVDLASRGITPLHAAAANGHASIMKMLLCAGAEAMQGIEERDLVALLCLSLSIYMYDMYLYRYDIYIYICIT